MSDLAENADNPHEARFAPKDKSPVPPHNAEVLPVLRNWQVGDEPFYDIDGEALLIAHDLAEERADRKQGDHETDVEPGVEKDVASPAIVDQHHPALVATLVERVVRVNPGDEASFTLNLLNNGDRRAYFSVTVEGWIHDHWLVAPVPQVELEPGEQCTVSANLAPPRTPDIHAGDRALAFVIRADAYPGRLTRLGATLTILPWVVLRLGSILPQSPMLTWWRQQATLKIPIINRSNGPVAIQLGTRSQQELCNTSVELPGVRRGAQIQTTIAAGETAHATIYTRLRSHPFIALRNVITPLQLTVATVQPTLSSTGQSTTTDADAPETALLPYVPWTRSASISVTATPLLGLWQLTSMLGVTILMVTGLGIAAVMAFLIFLMDFRQPEIPAQPAPAPPPVIIAYIQAPVPNTEHTTETVPVPAPNAAGHVVLADQPIVQAAPAAPIQGVDGAVPILSADQVSAPGELFIPTPAAILAPPATPTPMTYATLFHEVAQQYGLNWRVLAAQAYVESGFDSVALGAQGDLGLMQILPATWHEWAPTLDVADPFDSYSNVLVGAAYLHYLHSLLSERGYPEMEWALVAYNWGIDKVLTHLESGKGWQELAPIRQRYATEILRLAETIPADS